MGRITPAVPGNRRPPPVLFQRANSMMATATTDIFVKSDNTEMAISRKERIAFDGRFSRCQSVLLCRRSELRLLLPGTNVYLRISDE